MLCAKLIHVTSPAKLNTARQVHWFPASQATLHVCFLTNNVNFGFKAAGTNAAHRLSSVPISEMGQLALGKKMRGEKGSQHYLTKTMCQNVFLSHKKSTGTFRKTKHPSHLLPPVP